MKLTVSSYVADKLLGINKTDLRISTLKGSGPGGQHRNKTETAVRIVHIKTGITVVASDNKSQTQNRKNAFKRLILKLAEHYKKEEFAAHFTGRPTERIRTYNKQRGTVKDHRTGVVADYNAVLDGDIDCFISVFLS